MSVPTAPPSVVGRTLIPGSTSALSPELDVVWDDVGFVVTIEIGVVVGVVVGVGVVVWLDVNVVVWLEVADSEKEATATRTMGAQTEIELRFIPYNVCKRV